METVQLDFLGDLVRTHSCGELRVSDAGSRALLMGWVHRRRDLGGVLFIHLRDRDGVTQLVFREERNSALHEKVEKLGSEYVIAVEGHVEKRAPETVNPAIPTGGLEVVAEKLWIVYDSSTRSIHLFVAVDVHVDARLIYPYRELPRTDM